MSAPDQDTANAGEKKLPFHLRGNYAPVQDERTDLTLPVTGTLPPELDGLYLRNGANPSSGWSPHWFAGDGMVHGVRLADGEAAWYRNRFVQTRALNEKGARTIGADGAVDHTVGVNNTHVIDHAGRILALVESSFPCELSPELDTVGIYDFDGRLDTAMTAHPKICPVTGEMHFFGYGFAPPYLTYHRVDADGVLVQTEVIDVPGPTMIHDFSITETQVIFMDLPVVFDLERAMSGGMPYGWDDDYGARVGVMPRGVSGVQPTWFDVDPCYVFHPLNSFDRQVDGRDTVVIDTARYPELWRSDATKFKNDAMLHRWTLDLTAGTVHERQLDDRDIEFPRVADDVVGRTNRYGYAVGTFGDTNTLVKYDLDTDASTIHDFGPDRIPGEAVFCPAAGDEATTTEDAGWLMAFVYDKTTDTSDLVILDATDMAADPQAVVSLPTRVPFGFHGTWIPSDRLAGIGS